MTYDTDYFPTAEEAREGVVYLAKWDGGADNDGEACTYDEARYDAYESSVIRRLEGRWTTETDDTGVYLVEISD